MRLSPGDERERDGVVEKPHAEEGGPDPPVARQRLAAEPQQAEEEDRGERDAGHDHGEDRQLADGDAVEEERSAPDRRQGQQHRPFERGHRAVGAGWWRHVGSCGQSLGALVSCPGGGGQSVSCALAVGTSRGVPPRAAFAANSSAQVRAGFLCWFSACGRKTTALQVSRPYEDRKGWRRAGVAGVGFLDRPGRDLHRHRGAGPGRGAAPGEAVVGEPGALCRRGAARDPGVSRARGGGADPGGAGGERQDGDDGGDQRAPRAQGRAGGAGDDPRARGAAPDRLPEPAAALRPAYRAAGDALFAGHRGAGAGQGGRDGRGAARRGAPGGRAGGGAGGGALGLRHRLRARLPAPGARGGGGGAGAGGGVRAGLGQPRGQPADEDGEPRRHHRGRRLSHADPAALHRPGGGGVRGGDGRQAHVHAVLGRADRGGALPGQGRDPERAGGRRGRGGEGRARSPGSGGSSASTWAGPRPTSATSPASSSGCCRPRSPGCGSPRR